MARKRFHKRRFKLPERRSETFADHFSQAKMFLDSQSPAERAHLVEAFQFEVAKVERPAIRERGSRCSARSTRTSPPRSRSASASPS